MWGTCVLGGASKMFFFLMFGSLCFYDPVVALALVALRMQGRQATPSHSDLFWPITAPQRGPSLPPNEYLRPLRYTVIGLTWRAVGRGTRGCPRRLLSTGLVVNVSCECRSKNSNLGGWIGQRGTTLLLLRLMPLLLVLPPRLLL